MNSAACSAPVCHEALGWRSRRIAPHVTITLIALDQLKKFQGRMGL